MLGPVNFVRPGNHKLFFLVPPAPSLPGKNEWNFQHGDDLFDSESQRTSSGSSAASSGASRQTSPPPEDLVQKDADSDFSELTLLDDVDVSDQLVKKDKPDGTGFEIRGGTVDALIVHAASTGRHGKDEFQTSHTNYCAIPKTIILDYSLSKEVPHITPKRHLWKHCKTICYNSSYFVFVFYLTSVL